MFLFRTKNASLKDRNVMNGITDYHSHILFGLDDGVQSCEESLKILGLYEELGVESLWFTPHIMADVPNTTQAIRERFGQMRASYENCSQNGELKGNIQLHFAAEYMLDSLFEERLESNDLLPLGEGGMHILVETSFYNPPYNFWEIIETIKSRGYFPVLAHPERYLYMDKKDYAKLKEKGVKFQMNLGSISGMYSPESKARAENLIKNRYYEIVGSDTHSRTMIQNILGRKEVNLKSFEVFRNLGL